MKKFIIRFFVVFSITLLIIPLASGAFLTSGNTQVAASHSSIVAKKIVKKKAIKKKKKKMKVKQMQQTEKKSVETSPSGTGLTTDTLVPSGPKAWDVSINNFAFLQNSLMIKKGDSVKFTNKEDIPHQIASDPHPVHTNFTSLNSGILNKDGTSALTFSQPGTFTYHCHLHPNMKGTITVTE